MISSMTGYGRAEKISPQAKVAAEIYSVNNRYSEIQIRLPRFLSLFEPKVKELISASISRGKINFSLNWEDLSPAEERLKLNLDSAKVYYKMLKQLKKEFKLKGELELEDFLHLPDLIKMEKEEIDTQKIWSLIEEVAKAALEQLNQMRKKEGEALANELRERTKSLSPKLDEIEKIAKSSLVDYAEKLRQRIKQMLGEVGVDQTRLAQEVAMMTDKIDVTEECIRFRSHQAQFLETLDQNGAVGKKLGFILQELNREANTLGAKAIDYGISERVIFLKEELEKIREQIQNVE